MYIGTTSEVRPRNMIGESAGLNLRNDGGLGMPAGSSGIAAAIAVCTSTAALSMSRSRSNCSVTLLLPVALDDVISSRPAMVVNWRSSGLATAARQAGADVQRGEIDVGQIADRERAIGDDAEHGDARHDQAGRDRTL